MKSHKSLLFQIPMGKMFVIRYLFAEIYHLCGSPRKPAVPNSSSSTSSKTSCMWYLLCKIILQLTRMLGAVTVQNLYVNSTIFCAHSGYSVGDGEYLASSRMNVPRRNNIYC